MLLFGHLGITLGAFIGIGRLIPRLKSLIDLRYLAIGALLPDLIDKPIGKVIFASTFANGFIIGHTLLFSCLLVLAGIYLYQKRRDIRVFTLASGCFFHILKDQVWRQPQTFLWPLLGWSFPRDSIDNTGFEYLLKEKVRKENFRTSTGKSYPFVPFLFNLHIKEHAEQEHLKSSTQHKETKQWVIGRERVLK